MENKKKKISLIFNFMSFRIFFYSNKNEGETDWKVLCIDVDNPNASKLNGMNNLKK